jgi:hypothetical protein
MQAERPVHMSADVKEHRDGVNVTCAAKIFEHIFSKTVDVACLAVVCVEEKLNMFLNCVYSVCMGTSPSRTRLEFCADCNRDKHLRFHPPLNPCYYCCNTQIGHNFGLRCVLHVSWINPNTWKRFKLYCITLTTVSRISFIVCTDDVEVGCADHRLITIGGGDH